MSVRIRECPRCGGNLVPDEAEDPGVYQCLQCARRWGQPRPSQRRLDLARLLAQPVPRGRPRKESAA